MAVRILLAVVVGGLLGLERERRSSPAGFRTYMLVAIGSSMTIMLSQYIDLMLSTQWAATAQSVGATHDVSRFGAQVINGIGFVPAPVGDKGRHVHRVGDCVAIGNLRTVIWRAWDVCMKI